MKEYPERLNARQRRSLALRDMGCTYKEIAKEFGVSITRARDIVFSSKALLTTPPHPFDDLPGVAKYKLRRAGFETKEEVKEAIENGTLIPGSVWNYGNEVHKNVCKWVGYEYFEPKPKKTSDETLNTYIRVLERNGYKVTKT